MYLSIFMKHPEWENLQRKKVDEQLPRAVGEEWVEVLGGEEWGISANDHKGFGVIKMF